MSYPTCSVIIPAYNAEKTIINCLESFSLSDSSYPDLEIIVVNDGSKDKTKEIAENYLATYKYCMVISSANKGVSSARNIGIDAAHGRWVFFCDSDDTVSRSVLDRMIQTAESVKCDILVAKYKINDKSDSVNEDGFISNELLDREYIESKVISSYVRGEGMTSIWNSLYSHDVIKEYGIAFDENRTAGEDRNFNIDFFLSARSMYVIMDAVYIYHCDNKNPMERNQRNSGVSIIDDYKRMIELNERYKFYEQDSFEIKYLTKKFICLCIGYLELEKVSRKDKKIFLKNKSVQNAIEMLLKLKKDDILGWNMMNHFAMWLLKTGQLKILMNLHYRFKMNLIPNYSK